MEDNIKRWTAKCKTVLILEIIQGKTSGAEAIRAYDLLPSEIEEWVAELHLRAALLNRGSRNSTVWPRCLFWSSYSCVWVWNNLAPNKLCATKPDHV
jgi:hypothetical protein